VPDARAARADVLSRAVAAARELCDLLWDGLHQELREPDELRVRELSERLALVSSTVALLTGRPGQEPPAHAEHLAPPLESRPASAECRGAPGETHAEPAERRTPPEPIWTERSTPAEDHGPPPSPPTPHPAAQMPRAQSEPARMRLVDEHVPQAAEPAPVGPMRPEQGASAWVNTVGRLLARHAVDGLPFAVLLVELVDIARLEHSEPPAEIARLVAQVEGAIVRAMRAEDELSRESLGRYWLVAPETNGTGARMLAERLARLVRGSASHRGVPLQVAIGIAVCPEDGCQAPELAARADLSVYSARATGRPVARAQPPG
jgi:GGDEF domain-containing protein